MGTIRKGTEKTMKFTLFQMDNPLLKQSLDFWSDVQRSVLKAGRQDSQERKENKNTKDKKKVQSN